MIKNLAEFNEFKLFSLEHKESGDIDPVYPVLRMVQKLRGYSFEVSIWHTLLYVTWYHLGSCETMMELYSAPSLIDSQPRLKTGVERRGFRGNNKGSLLLNYLIQSHRGKSLEDWLRRLMEEAKGAKGRWENIYNDFATMPGNGVWAPYKWCDLCKNVLRLPITSPDIGLGGRGKNAGPVPGLSRLTGEPWERCAKDIDLQEKFFQFCLSEGIPWDGMEEMETALCDFNTYRKGQYYVGHDIDLMMEQIAGIPNENDYWVARQWLFPRKYLGEEGGWFGLRKERTNGASHRVRGCPRKR